MSVKNLQLEREAKKQKSSALAPTVAVDEGAWWTKETDGIVEGFFVDSQGREIQVTEDGVLKAPVVGEANTGANAGAIGDGIFKGKNGVTLEFKRIKAGANIALTPTADSIEISATPTILGGEVITGENIGLSGSPVFKQKTAGGVLQFYRVLAGSGITITITGNEEILITNTGMGGGEANTASSLGVGPGDGESLVGSKVGTDLPFRRIKAGTGVSVASTPNSVTISAPGEANNLVPAGSNPDGESLVNPKVGTNLVVKRIKAGAGMSIVSEDNDILIAALGGAQGEANTASSLGSGPGDGESLVGTKTGVDLPFRRIKAGTGVSVASSPNSVTISSPGEANTASALGTISDGESLVGAKVGADLPFRRIKGGSGVSVVASTNGLTLTSATPQRYVASAVVDNECVVTATGEGVTYARSGTIGTLTIPGGVFLLSFSIRIPASMASASFTIVHSQGDNAIETAYPPNIVVYNDGGTKSVRTTQATLNVSGSGYHQIVVSNLDSTGTQGHRIKGVF